MKKVIMWIFILSLFGCNNSKSQSNKIPLEKIEEMFSNMHANGVNTDTTMRWGYFFTSNKKEKFDQVANELKNKKFELVEIYQADDKSYWLHLQRKEIHNAKSLYAIDEELYVIADKYKIIYDGFDVGNVDKDKPIERDTYAVPEQFKTLDYQKDNFPCLLIGNVAFDNFLHKEEFCYFIKVTTAYQKDEKVMLPTSEELDKLDKFEFFIEVNFTQDNVNSYYEFGDPHEGISNFDIVRNDKTGAMEVINLMKRSEKLRALELEILRDQSWNLYNGVRQRVI